MFIHANRVSYSNIVNTSQSLHSFNNRNNFFYLRKIFKNDNIFQTVTQILLYKNLKNVQ
jgi:hypothetical protein